MCSRSPNLSAALEIAINAQMYLAEGKYELALEKFQSSLGILIPALPEEPNGKRKELLYRQVRKPMFPIKSRLLFELFLYDHYFRFKSG